jgi:hypothetical protein
MSAGELKVYHITLRLKYEKEEEKFDFYDGWIPELMGWL